MSTILTDDDRPKLPEPEIHEGTVLSKRGRYVGTADGYTTEQTESYADAREAAVLAKLAQQEPVAWADTDVQGEDKGLSWTPGHFHKVPLYTRPAPQQTDRQRVPEGYVLVPVEPTIEMLEAMHTENLTFYASEQREAYAAMLAAMLAAAPEAQAQAKEISPEFTDTARAALLWVLWHHQGGSSDVGQPIRFALGMGQYEKLNAHQVREAKRWAALNPKPTPEAPSPRATRGQPRGRGTGGDHLHAQVLRPGFACDQTSFGERIVNEQNQDALRCAGWCDEHSSGAYRTSAEAAAHIRRLVAENEAKDALLRKVVEPLEEITRILNAVLGVSGGFPPGADGPAVEAKEAITAIRQHLGQKVETG